MRVGQNPAKKIKKVIKPQRITIAVLNYIPNQQGYFAESFEVLKRCLGSIVENTKLPYDLMVFDNGSCAEVKDYLLELQAVGKIQYLVFSEKNVGKGGAWEFIFHSAPGDVIAYSDNDAFYYAGWLKESLKVLEAFPDVGMVTARPLRTIPELSTNTIRWAKNTPKAQIEEGDFISYAEFYEFSSTLGYSDEKLEKEYKNKKDIRLTYENVQAYVGANHFQFIGWKKILQSVTPFDMQKPLGQVKQLDERLNAGGFLRLMTTKPLIQNMSNQIPESIKAPEQKPGKKDFHLRDVPILKKILLWTHDRIFKIYYDK